MTMQNPTKILRITHLNNLKIFLNRKGLHAPTVEPDDGQTYKVIHDVEIQQKRQLKEIPCGPKGHLNDYVPFYFGYLSPMLFRLHTGKVQGYNEGQSPIIYLVSYAQEFKQNEIKYVFSDGHGVKRVTKWYDDLIHLNKIDMSMVNEKYWTDNIHDNDRQRKKQAEFLVYRFCCWSYIKGIAVFNDATKALVLNILELYPTELHKPVKVFKNWYY